MKVNYFRFLSLVLQWRRGMSLKRDEFHLHLKRLPSIASGAISIQSYVKNTKMVYSTTAKIM